MKSTINRLIFCTVIAVIPFQLSAARMFILFNEDCMERLEYQSPNRNADPFVAYQINVGDGEKVILEIGQESRNTTSKLPTPTVGCDNGVFNLSMVQKINAHIDEVFLVVKKNNRRYTVSPVNFATHFAVQGDVISVFSPKYKFEFNTKEGAIGENISRQSTADVFFEGRLEKECTGAYVFRQIAQGSRTPYTDLVLIPEVGIIEMRSGQTLDQALTNGMHLAKVNDDKFDDFLEEKCEESLSDNVLANAKPGQAGESEVTPTGPVGYDMTVKQGSVRPRNNNATNRVNTNPNTTAQRPQPANQVGGTNQYHIVKKGETLYRISKQYNISVGQIKSWNNLNSNLIRTGSQLMVGTVSASNNANSTVPTTTPNAASSVPTNTNTVASNTNNRPRYYPAPYNTTYRPNNANSNSPSNEVLTARGGQDVYVVKPGDTVASLAMRFGYTESKFRSMNNLNGSDFIKIGQELKTSDCNCPPANSSSIPTVDTPQEFNFVQQEKGIEDSNFTTPAPANNNTAPRNYPVNFNDTPIQTTSSTPYIPQNEEAYRNSSSSPSPLYSPRGVQTGNTSNSLLGTERQTTTSSRQPSPYDAIIPSSFDTYSPITTGNKDQASRGIPANKPAGTRRQHVVQDGENIFQIARMYNITTERLRTLNGLEVGEVIIPTQKLYIE